MKVFIKLEKQGKNLLVRVENGLLSIGDFLETYTPIELEKLERYDALKKFQQQLQDILVFHDGNDFDDIGK